MNLVLVGAPLSGKGTQAELISKYFGLMHISTGDLLREVQKQDTPLGNLVKKYLSKAQLVPDDVTIKVLKEKLSSVSKSKGVLLDGFPRTLYQAKQLKEFLHIDAAIYIKVELENVLTRIKHRYICSVCKKTGIAENELIPCSSCGGQLVKRLDDTPEIVRERFKEFELFTHQVLDFYKLENKLKIIDGNKQVKQVFEDIKVLLEAL